MPSSKTVLVSGASGLIGSALVEHLRSRGDTVLRLVRGSSAPAPGSLPWDPQTGEMPTSGLEDVDVVVNLSGAPIGTRRWTSGYRTTIVESRTRTTHVLSAWIASQAEPPALVQASAIGRYPDSGADPIDESAPVDESFLGHVVQTWESAATPARRAGARVAFARTGIVLTPDGGAVPPLLRLLRLGLGGPMSSGKQLWAWITMVDEIRALTHLIDSDLEGPANLVAPSPATNAELTRALARALGRPAAVRAPAWGLRLALGGFASELLASRNVLPAALLASGFEFEHPDLDSVIRWLIPPR
ncbi:hypothetical protein ATL41_0118 [Flavimobilis soli]|uniref:TIGR01777 family protein n=1 Tax=Flavimobilis soli TaxID=442709 RepID=A0A2A9E913_9MICO|nr:TIGR01777 family oxidoreductase [Flavimobilis soli]PFG35438.1 hypothetical protein ATL41_0118 [Flavimobilis soli]